MSTSTRWRHAWPEARTRKFRQAAFAYLHVAILLEATAYVMLRTGAFTDRFGPPVMYLLLGGGFAGLIVWSLYSLQNVWITRLVWAVHSLRLPSLISGAFFAGEAARFGPSMYLT
ncbi:MAG: hypothetical protein V3T56_07795, partial [Gemmatimonadales bacterium]